MKLLLDENVPVRLEGVLTFLLRTHEVIHVQTLKWKGTRDPALYSKARKKRFDVILTNDGNQLMDPKICKAIQRSGIHYVHYDLGEGLDGVAQSCASVLHAIRGVMAALEEADGQRVIMISGVRSSDNFAVLEPGVDRISPYWPGRKQYGNHQPSRRRS